MTLERIWCLISSHDWSRPYTDEGRRVERCESCSMVRDHVWSVPTAERMEQVSVDGTHPVTYTSTAQVLDGILRAERRAERDAIKARVHAKHGRVSTESKVQS